MKVSKETRQVLKDQGYESLGEYLANLSEDYDVDIETVEKRMAAVEKMARVGDKIAGDEKALLEKILDGLNKGIPVVEMKFSDGEKELVYDLWLLTSKRRMFVLNCKEGLEGCFRH